MSLLTRFKLGRDDGGYVTNEVNWAPGENTYKRALEGGVEATLPVPSWAYRFRLIVSPGSTVWCGHGDTPLALAIEGAWTLEASEMNPILRPTIDPSGNRITTLRFLAQLQDGADAYVQVIFYKQNDSEPTR